MMRKGVPTLVIALASALLVVSGCSDPVESRPTTPTETGDHEFDDGSLIASQELSAAQVENLALLARVWGFVKYHHPRVVDGSRNWDYALFRAVPSVLAASDRATAASAMVTWLDSLGPTPTCAPCATTPSNVHLPAEIDWIHDGASLGTALSDRLGEIHANRSVAPAQWYVSFAPQVGNPDFSHEADHASLSSPDAGYRLLALFRFWNIVEYWFPYRDVMEEDWDAALREFIPVMMGPLDGDAYRVALIRLIARIHDTHANLWSDLRVQPPVGSEIVPLDLRFIEGKLVVTGYADAALGPATGLSVGDEIHAVDGVPVTSLVDSLRPLYPASNEAARMRDLARRITRGNGPVTLEGVGASGGFSLSVPRAPIASLTFSTTHDLTGPTFQRITDSVAYLKLSSVESARAADYVAQAEGAAVLVVDIRNYPSEFVVFSLGGRLIEGAESFARFTGGDASNPGAFRWISEVALSPITPRFAGRVVILVDETTQSQAEYTTMAFRTAPDALVVGSTTAGADGNVSPIPLPGGARAMISGIGVFYPDRTPTQRVGIVPDLVVRPTIEGIRAGRDEVLEAGVSAALGRDFVLPQARGVSPGPR